MMPLTSKVGISRKIESQEDRRSVRDMLEQITVPDGMGYIIRTAGLGKTREQLQRDLNLLTTTWEQLEGRSQDIKSPALLYQEDDVVTRTIRDYFTEEVTEVLVDDKDVFETVLSYFKKMMPAYAHMVKLYRNKSALFSRHRIDDQVDSIFANKITLPSGGSIVIEQTEALVVIDVNSGKTSEGNLEATALKSNLEAAEEVARQLRLRDLGGLVVIDFIDQRERRHTQEVEQKLRDCLKKDKARITVTSISRFGLMEMSRQRINTSKEIRHYVDCSACNGHGRIKSMNLQTLDLLRKLKQHASNKMVKEVRLTCDEESGAYLLNERRQELMSLETEFDTRIRVVAKAGFTGKPNFEPIKRSREEKETMVMPPPLSLSTMAASMSDKAINEQKDYREEKLEALEKLSFEEMRGVEIPTPQSLTPFERFNFSVRVTLMKRHGLYEARSDEFQEAIKESIIKGGKTKVLLPASKNESDSSENDDFDEMETESSVEDSESSSEDQDRTEQREDRGDRRRGRRRRSRRWRGSGERGEGENQNRESSSSKGKRDDSKSSSDGEKRNTSPELLEARAKKV
jgi:ribonuclease E